MKQYFLKLRVRKSMRALASPIFWFPSTFPGHKNRHTRIGALKLGSAAFPTHVKYGIVFRSTPGSQTKFLAPLTLYYWQHATNTADTTSPCGRNNISHQIVEPQNSIPTLLTSGPTPEILKPCSTCVPQHVAKKKSSDNPP